VLIAYVPLTLAPVLINMRYTVTVQPLMFVFMAIALSSMARLPGPTHMSESANTRVGR